MHENTFLRVSKRKADRMLWEKRVRDACAKFGRNRAFAAEALGVSERTLRNWIHDLGLPKFTPSGAMAKAKAIAERFGMSPRPETAACTCVESGNNVTGWTPHRGGCPIHGSAAKPITGAEFVDAIHEAIPDAFSDLEEPIERGGAKTKCARCGGSGRLTHDNAPYEVAKLRWAPCPACQPSGGA